MQLFAMVSKTRNIVALHIALELHFRMGTGDQPTAKRFLRAVLNIILVTSTHSPQQQRQIVV
jgi:hypothetical protein